jgi:hypothetical protein
LRLMVTAVRVLGRVARAYEIARRVGRCSREIRTTAWLREGSVGG